MFWGLILKSNKKYTQKIDKPFHVSQAALDHTTADNEPVQVMYTHEDSCFLLCTLQKGKVNQCALDLDFENDQVSFSTKGNGIVHLTGFLVDKPEFDDELDDDEEMDEAEMMKMMMAMKNGASKGKASKKKAAEIEDEDESDDDDYEEGMNTSNGSAVADDDDDSLDDEEAEDEESDDDDDEDGDDDEEDESEEEIEPPKKQAKTDGKAAQNGKKEKQQNGAQNGEGKKQKEKDAKAKDEGGKIIKMQGGLMAQELKVGGGAEAKLGKKVQVYYEGRLKTNNKVFDAAKSGPGFKFMLGKGEVIKGWDLGVAGMKVGGKRRLVIPPGLAYGARGSPPVIPQNSTLVFDVELKNVF